MNPKPPRGQRSLPFQSKEEALADMYARLVRIESKLSKLMLHMGLDENGYPARKPAAKQRASSSLVPEPID